MKIGLLSTISTNIGDDFIRYGIINLLNTLYDDKMDFEIVNKHNPASIYHKTNPIFWTQFLPKGRIYAAKMASSIFSRFKNNRFESCDLIIQCGTPVYWEDCHKAEWAKLIWHDIIGRLSSTKTVINIAAGTCYPWEKRDEDVSNEKDHEYIKEIYGYCKITTVRDRLAHHLLNKLNLPNTLLPCTALLAGKYYKQNENPRTIFVNYMHMGGHFDYGQEINPDKWYNVLKTTLKHLSKNYDIAFICHNALELELTKEKFPEYSSHLPTSVEHYFTLAQTGIVGIFNRLHASVGFAGLGIPSIAIGTDTRMLMVENIKNPIMYIKDVESENLIKEVEAMIANRQEHSKRLIELRDNTFESYQTLISNVFPNIDI